MKNSDAAIRQIPAKLRAEFCMNILIQVCHYFKEDSPINGTSTSGERAKEKIETQHGNTYWRMSLSRVSWAGCSARIFSA